ncbi:unnamed protein product [Dracunculus medinensis]|uniref:VWFA domain-containing protein n=1 Tax=Dracunculus medinensis TaxID=318479 RepID=A0A0N4U4A0_DRAME|nr:unnamed protein product [Dracunculus medinensis]
MLLNRTLFTIKCYANLFLLMCEKQQFLRNFIPLLWLPYKYATEMWIWIMITSIPLTLECIWPIVDALFVIDGQANVGIINHELIKKFAYKIAQQMPISQSNSHVALAQYTPLTELQFSLISGTSQSEIESTPYVPCRAQNTSLNSIVKMGLNSASGNRQWIPDAVIVISSEKNNINEVNNRENLVAPISPIHIFLITIGSLDDPLSTINKFTSAATTLTFSAISYETLPKLIKPICQSANDFIRTFDVGFAIAIIVLILLFLLSLLLLYALYQFWHESKHCIESIRQKFLKFVVMKMNLYTSFPLKFPKYLDKQLEDPNIANYRREDNAADEDGDDVTIEADFHRYDRSFLPPGHPAKALPPIDLLFLIDASSSIGNVNFENLQNFFCEDPTKKYIIAVLKNVDISAGRSRVAVILFAQEPLVSFGFNKYYTHGSIIASIKRLPYLGGPTHLAKALLFASGLLYHEQNLRNGKHRKHKFLPTPRHDRLQVIIVVSDGYSEDDFEKVSHILYDKMHVKIAAMVHRTFSRSKLLPLTRFDESIFSLDQIEAISIWLWQQQVRYFYLLNIIFKFENFKF